METEKLAHLFIQLSVFGLVVAVWFAAVTLWMLRRSQRNRRLERRLQFAQQGADEERVIRLWHDGKAIDTFVPDTARMTWRERLERMRQDAGWQTSMPKVLALVGCFTLISGVLVWGVTGKWLLVGGTVAMIGIAFRSYLLRCIIKRTTLFEKQLVEALDLGARALRAGHPLSG